MCRSWAVRPSLALLLRFTLCACWIGRDGAADWRNLRVCLCILLRGLPSIGQGTIGSLGLCGMSPGGHRLRRVWLGRSVWLGRRVGLGSKRCGRCDPSAALAPPQGRPRHQARERRHRPAKWFD